MDMCTILSEVLSTSNYLINKQILFILKDRFFLYGFIEKEIVPFPFPSLSLFLN